ncbi:MAG: insulinase family protein [Myxococcaceae bacterium]|nr:insulinase family protein [Myxococcaceae bacterium]
MVALSLAVLLSAAPAAAPAVPKPFTFVTEVEGLREYRLPNGLKVLFMNDGSKPTVTVNLTIFVGSRHEGYGEKGMAHLLEHMLFKGSPRTPDPKKALSEHGAQANGTTWFDRTNYYETIPASPENLDWALRFEADRLVNSFVRKTDLDSEMTVVRNEYEMGENNPANVLSDRVMATAYGWHNYGMSTIGPRSDIELVPIENLQGFYKRHYRVDNALLVVAGKFDEAQAFKVIADSFGKLSAPKAPLPRTWTAEPVQDGERSVTVRRAGGVPVLIAGYHIPAGSDPELAPVDVLGKALGDAPSGRLYQALVEPKLAAHADCNVLQLAEPGFLYCEAELKPGDDPTKAKAALVGTLEGLAKKPFTAEEVDRAKTTLLKDIDLILNAPERVGLVLSETAALGDWRTLFLHRNRLRAVTADDVNRVAQRYLKTTNRTSGEYVPTEKPDRAEIPPTPDVAAMLKDFKGDASLAEGEVFAATPANIDARTTRSALPNGLKLALLPKKTRGERVNVALILRFGSEQSLKGQRVYGDLVAQLLRRGTTTKTREQFQDALDQLKASLHVQPAPQGVVVSLEVRKPQLPAALDLVADMLRTPALDPKELETLRRELLADLESKKSEPMALGSLAIQRLVTPFPKGHPLYVPSHEELMADVAAAKVESLKAFHARFYGVQNAQLAAVGDFDAAALTAQLTKRFGDFTAKEAFARIPQPHQPVAAKVDVSPTPDKANAFLGAVVTFPLKETDADYPAMVLADYMLGGGFLNGRIPLRLREKEGLSYGAGTQLRTHPIDDSAALIGYAIYAPSNDGKVETGYREELARAVTQGFTADELKVARPGLLQEREQEFADDGHLAVELSQQLYLGRTMAYEAQLDEKLKGLQLQEIGAALKKLVDPAKLAVFKAGDFKKLDAPK